MEKRRLISLMLAGVMSTSVGALAGCNGCNKNVFDMNYKLEYIVVEENGNSILHKIKSWDDSESESVTARTECCNNYIWTSANNSVLYEKKPAEHAYDLECGLNK